MSSDEERPVLRHIDLPLEPGARIVVKHSPGWALLDPLRPASATPQGYTIDVNGRPVACGVQVLIHRP